MLQSHCRHCVPENLFLYLAPDSVARLAQTVHMETIWPMLVPNHLSYGMLRRMTPGQFSFFLLSATAFAAPLGFDIDNHMSVCQLIDHLVNNIHDPDETQNQTDDENHWRKNM